MYGCTLFVNDTDFCLYHSNTYIYINSCNFRFYNQIFVQLFYCFQNSFILHIMARHVFRALCLISGITTKFETHQYCIVNKFNFYVNSCVLDFFSANRTFTISGNRSNENRNLYKEYVDNCNWYIGFVVYFVKCLSVSPLPLFTLTCKVGIIGFQKRNGYCTV